MLIMRMMIKKKMKVAKGLTCVMMRSAPVPSSSLNLMSGLSLRTRSLNLGSVLVMAPSAMPLAPRVFSDTLGTCCLNTSGVSLRGRRRLPDPRPGPHSCVTVDSRRTSRVTATKWRERAPGVTMVIWPHVYTSTLLHFSTPGEWPASTTVELWCREVRCLCPRDGNQSGTYPPPPNYYM